MVSVAVLLTESIEGVIDKDVVVADIGVKCGEWGEVHGLKHSSAFIEDLLSQLANIDDPPSPSVSVIEFPLGEAAPW